MRVCSQRQSTTIPETEEIQSPPEQDTQPNSQHMDSSNHNHHELTFTSLAPPPYITSTCIHQQNSPPPPLTSSASTITSPTNSTSASSPTSSSSRYENQKRRDWNTFGQYLKNHKPPLTLSRCSGAHVLEFLRYLDQFGKTKVHAPPCPFYGHPNPPAPCPCPLRQAWGSLDALIGRLRAAFEENGGKPETNPFGARAVRLFLREVRDQQSKARGISYEKKKRKRPPQQPMAPMTQLNASGTVATTDNVDNIGTMYSFHRQPHHQVLDHRMVLMFPRGAATRYVYEGAT